VLQRIVYWPLGQNPKLQNYILPLTTTPKANPMSIVEQFNRYKNALTAENYDTLEPVKLPRGMAVRCNGFIGSIVRHYAGTMHEILLPGGLVCSGDFEIVAGSILSTY